MEIPFSRSNILIFGVPGSGKSTVSQYLNFKFGEFSSIDLDEIASKVSDKWIIDLSQLKETMNYFTYFCGTSDNIDKVIEMISKRKSSGIYLRTRNNDEIKKVLEERNRMTTNYVARGATSYKNGFLYDIDKVISIQAALSKKWADVKTLPAFVESEFEEYIKKKNFVRQSNERPKEMDLSSAVSSKLPENVQKTDTLKTN